MDDLVNPVPPSLKKAPPYFNPHNVVQDSRSESTPFLSSQPPVPDPGVTLQKKYPIKLVVGFAVLAITVLSIPVAVYLSQRPTRIFIEAEPTVTPTPTPTPTPTETPTASPSAMPNQ